MTLTAGPDAGWYPDPASGSAWRWWDGATWTDHVRAKEAEAVPAAVIPNPQPAPIAQGIPQPGQVAAAPSAPTGGPVSMTPSIPVTDQKYWHSDAAEVIEVPRLPHTTNASTFSPGRSGHVPSYVRDWNDLGSPNTVGIWLLALLPVLAVPVWFGLGLLFAMVAAPLDLTLVAVTGVVIGLGWIFAWLDQRALARRGYHPPSVWWMLVLPPLAYLISRGKSVRRERMRAWPPELVFVAGYLLTGGTVLLFSTAVPVLMLMTAGL